MMSLPTIDCIHNVINSKVMSVLCGGCHVIVKYVYVISLI